jgi:hypothetical protein
MNFRNMTGLRRRVQWLREQLFPPVSYMEKRYGPRSGVGMGVLYLQRIWRSLRQFLSARIGHR